MIELNYLIIIAFSSAIGCVFGVCTIVSLDKDVNIEKYIKLKSICH